MSRPRLRAALLLGGIFVLGALTGGAGMRVLTARRVRALYDPPEGAVRRLALWNLDRSLDLDRGQRERIDQVLASHEPERLALWRQVAPPLAQLRRRERDQIRELLRPDQQTAYDQQSARAEQWIGRALKATPSQREAP